MNRDAAAYVEWLEQGHSSSHCDAVRAALSEEPRTRREVAAVAGVSVGFAGTALEALVALREAKRAGTRRDAATDWRAAKLYALRSSGRRAVPAEPGPRGLSFDERRQLREAVSDARRAQVAAELRRGRR